LSNIRRLSNNLQIFCICLSVAPLYAFSLRSPTGDLFIYTEIAQGLRRSGDLIWDLFSQYMYNIFGSMVPLLVTVFSLSILKYVVIRKRSDIDARLLLTFLVCDLVFLMPEREFAQLRNAAAVSLVSISIFSNKTLYKYTFFSIAIAFHISSILLFVAFLKRSRLLDTCALPLLIVVDFILTHSDVLYSFNRSARYLSYSDDHTYMQMGNFYILSFCFFIALCWVLMSNRFNLTEQQYRLTVVSAVCFGLSFILRDFAIFSDRLFGMGVPFFGILILMIFPMFKFFAKVTPFLAILILLFNWIHPSHVLTKIVFS